MTLGLQYGTVALVAHTATWSRAFEQERERIGQALRGLRYEIEHVGSTAVPGLLAKPIVDVAVRGPVVLTAFIPAIERAGLLFRGDKGVEGGHLFVRELRPGFRTHHVHLVAAGDPQWASYLSFRDLLRDNVQARDRYAESKIRLARDHPTDRAAYTAGKNDVVRALLSEFRDDPRLAGRLAFVEETVE